MKELSEYLKQLNTNANVPKQQIVDEVVGGIQGSGYAIVDLNDTKPWGAYIRMDGSQAERFISDFFPGLTLTEAQLGMKDAELSPKILIVAPQQRLSWQYHDRRAERWAFLTEGGYHKSDSDEQGELVVSQPGTVVQFKKGERHRLVGTDDKYAVVAEIWQHTDTDKPSDEDDIVRLADDYQR